MSGVIRFSARCCVSLVFAWLLVACAPRGIAPNYSKATGCPQDEVHVEKQRSVANVKRYRASGCGNGVEYYCHGNRCRAPAFVARDRHARQFGCGVTDVAVQPLGGGAWQASGCGQTLTYQCVEEREIVVRCIAETTELAGGAVSPP